MVRTKERTDWAEWTRLRCALWPHHSADEHEAEMTAWLARPDDEVYFGAWVRRTRAMRAIGQVLLAVLRKSGIDRMVVPPDG